jgi:hypothetical protein
MARTTIAALEAENASLREEISQLRAECAQLVAAAWVPVCTCIAPVTPGVTITGCPVHQRWFTSTVQYPTNVCAGGYAGSYLVIVPAGTAQPAFYPKQLTAGACAGPGVIETFTVTTP